MKFIIRWVLDMFDYVWNPLVWVYKTFWNGITSGADIVWQVVWRPFRPYWRYILRTNEHRWAVRKAGKVLGVSWWRRWKHDWTKYMPSELFFYARYFGKPHDERKQEDFDYLKKFIFPLHKSRHDHHREYWMGQPMTREALDEMVADWWAAGFTYNDHNPDVKGWYLRNKHKLGIHEENEYYVEQCVELIDLYQYMHPDIILTPKEKVKKWIHKHWRRKVL